MNLKNLSKNYTKFHNCHLELDIIGWMANKFINEQQKRSGIVNNCKFPFKSKPRSHLLTSSKPAFYQ